MLLMTGVIIHHTYILEFHSHLLLPIIQSIQHSESHVLYYLCYPWYIENMCSQEYHGLHSHKCRSYISVLFDKN